MSESLEQRIPDLYQLAFIPGVFKCPQCGFVLSRTTLNVAQGVVGTTERDRESSECPNDGTFMVHVTYREQLEECNERCFAEIHANAALKARAEAAEDRLTILDAQDVGLPPLVATQRDLAVAIKFISMLKTIPSTGHMQALAENLSCRERQLLDALRAGKAVTEVARKYRNEHRLDAADKFRNDCGCKKCKAYDALAGNNG